MEPTQLSNLGCAIPSTAHNSIQSRCTQGSTVSKISHSRLQYRKQATSKSNIDSSSTSAAVPLPRRPYDWFSPGRLHLKDVDPRIFGANFVKSRPLLVTSESNCNQFYPSCMDAAWADIHGAKRFLMPFKGTSTQSHAPLQLRGSAGDHVLESAASGSTSEDTDSGEDDAEDGEADHDEVDARSSMTSVSRDIDKEASKDDGSETSSASSLSEFDVISKHAAQRNPIAQVHLLLCTRKDHPEYLHDQVYIKECMELRVSVNSRVSKLLLKGASCFCCLEVVSFANLLLGDRGVQAIVPLLKLGRRLKCLNLRGNNIRQNGFRKLSTVLNNLDACSLVSVIDMSYNPLSSTVAQEMSDLLQRRTSLLLFGCFKTELSCSRRQEIIKRSVANFAGADPCDMCKVWQRACPGSGFGDVELWVKCSVIVETACSREQLAECMEVLAGFQAGVEIPDSHSSSHGSSVNETITGAMLEAELRSTLKDSVGSPAHSLRGSETTATPMLRSREVSLSRPSTATSRPPTAASRPLSAMSRPVSAARRPMSAVELSVGQTSAVAVDQSMSTVRRPTSAAPARSRPVQLAPRRLYKQPEVD